MKTVSSSSTATMPFHVLPGTRPPLLPRISDAPISEFRFSPVGFPTAQPVESFYQSLAPWRRHGIWPCTDARIQSYRSRVSIVERTWDSHSCGTCARSCGDTSMGFYMEIDTSVVSFSFLGRMALLLPCCRICEPTKNDERGIFESSYAEVNEGSIPAF